VVIDPSANEPDHNRQLPYYEEELRSGIVKKEMIFLTEKSEEIHNLKLNELI
jgi:hypothetical protein